MQKLENLVREYLDDTMWEAECVMRSDRGKNITIITDNLRGVCGITVITVMSPAQKISDHVERTLLKVKFFRQDPTVEQHMKRMSTDARKIDGVFSFIPKQARQVVSRIYRPGRRSDV
mgnify:FL=1|tara:strand:+ start:656 stop:1009 length:354 start_codon:yes stop_codon:yes gene_type:complete